MSPARKAKKAAKKAKTSKPKSGQAKAKAAKPKAAKPKASKAAKAKVPAKPEKAHCAATDPFGQPCQSIPRYGSKHCTIHSYLDR